MSAQGPGWPLTDLLHGQVRAWLGPDPAGVAVNALTLDVAEVRPGTVFVARVGWYGDTHTRLAEAIARGAAAVVVTRPEALPAPLTVPAAVAVDQDPTLARLSARLYGQPTDALEVLAVTGTNGKTSTTGIAAHLLAALGERPARMGTLDFSFEERVIAASNTTPDALVIQRFAHDARHLGATALVLEASSHGLALGRLAQCHFDAVGFTNLSRDHLDFHGTVAAYRAAKASLFGAHLGAALNAGKHPVAVAWVGPAPGDAASAEPDGTDEGEAMLRQTPEGTLRIAVGHPLALAQAHLPPGTARLGAEANALPDLAGQRCRFRWDDAAPLAVDLPLIGGHNLQNAAVALAMVVGRRPARFAPAVAALGSTPPIPGRLERVDARTWVDYAHTPAAVARILATVRAGTTLPLRVVLGCGGDRDPGKRGPMARGAVEVCTGPADAVWFTADNPRSEDPEHILDAMFAALSPAEAARVHREPDRARAIEAAIAAPGEAVVLILGKGHETTQTVGARIHHFDDRQEARRALRARAEGIDPAHAPLVWGYAEGDATDADTRLRELLARPNAAQISDFDNDSIKSKPTNGDASRCTGTRAEVLKGLTRRHRSVNFTDGPPPPEPGRIEGPHLPSLVSRR